MTLGHYMCEKMAEVQGYFPGGKHPSKREAKWHRAMRSEVPKDEAGNNT